MINADLIIYIKSAFAQAEVVVKIYQKYLSGVGIRKIAAELNADPAMIGKP